MECTFCGGKTIQLADGGRKCRNPRCQGATVAQTQGVTCECGEPMEYYGLNAYGEPGYRCLTCGSTTKL